MTNRSISQQDLSLPLRYHDTGEFDEDGIGESSGGDDSMIEMEVTKKSLFKDVDCIELYVPNLQEGMDYYCKSLGLKILWKSDTAVGLGMDDSATEILIQNERNQQIVDIKVNSVIDAVEAIKKAGGEIIHGPFEIKIGKCAVVKDPWGNQYVILDTTKGTFITDHDGNIIGQNAPG